MKKRKITLTDIAQETNVSISTVSRVLKQPLDQIKTTQEKKILETAASLGYKRKDTANKTVKVLRICFNCELFSQQLANAIKKYLGPYTKAELIFANFDSQDFCAEDFDGIVYSSCKNDSKLKDVKNIPIIRILGATSKPCAYDVVTFNNLLIGKIAADKLIKSSCTEFIWIEEFTNLLAFERFSGFRNALKTLMPEAIVHKFIGFTSVEAELLKKIKNSSNKKIGVFAMNDKTAYLFYSAVTALGILTPFKDFALVGCDNSHEDLKLFNKKPYTIELNLEDIGRIVAEKLVFSNRYYNNTPTATLVVPKLINP